MILQGDLMIYVHCYLLLSITTSFLKIMIALFAAGSALYAMSARSSLPTNVSLMYVNSGNILTVAEQWVY